MELDQKKTVRHYHEPVVFSYCNVGSSASPDKIWIEGGRFYGTSDLVPMHHTEEHGVPIAFDSVETFHWWKTNVQNRTTPLPED